MKNYLTFLGILLLTLLSCKKEDISEPVVPPQLIIEAGIDTEQIQVVTLDPVFEVVVEYDTANFFGYGEDSLDFNNDGSIDLIFKLNVLHPDSTHYYGTSIYNSNWSQLNITRRNNIQFPYEVFHHTTVDFQHWDQYYMPTYELGEEVFDTTLFGSVNSTSTAWVGIYNYQWYQSPWMNAHAYLIFKQDQNYGWLEIDNSDKRNPKVISVGYPI